MGTAGSSELEWGGSGMPLKDTSVIGQVRLPKPSEISEITQLQWVAYLWFYFKKNNKNST